MEKLLFISNDSKPSADKYNYIGEEVLTNFSIPIIKACQKIGISVTVGINRKNATKMTCKYPVNFYNAQIYRNPFNLKEVYNAYKNACQELKKGDYVAIHCNTPIGGVVGRLAGKKCGIKTIIYTAHGFHFYNGAPLINWLLYYPIERWLAHYTDVLITINQEDYQRAKSFKYRNQGKAYYVPGVGIDISEFSSIERNREEVLREFEISDDSVVIISAGDLNKNKNNKVIVKAMNILNNEKIHYLICGEGKLRTELENEVKKYGLEKKVHFLGYRTDIKRLMGASDIFVMPSFREGLSRSLMEAMATGLPCVASRIRGNIDLIESSEYLCDPLDCKAFASAIGKLAESDELRNRIGAMNNQRVHVFSTEIVENEILHLYEELFN